MAEVNSDILLAKLKDELNGRIQVKSETMTILEILNMYIEYFRKKEDGKEDLRPHFKNTRDRKNY